MAQNNHSKQFDQGFLVDNLPTQTDLYEFAEQIEQFLDSLFTVKDPIEDKIASAFTAQKKRVLLACIKKFNIDLKGPTIEEDLRVLVNTVRAIPTITLTLAIDPDERLINRIAAWVKTNHKDPLALAIVRKQNMIAGAIIGLDGKYFDYSLQNIIKQSVTHRTSA